MGRTDAVVLHDWNCRIWLDDDRHLMQSHATAPGVYDDKDARPVNLETANPRFVVDALKALGVVR